MNLKVVPKRFATPEARNDFLESMCWPDGIACRRCDSKRFTRRQTRAGFGKRLNPRTGVEEIKPLRSRLPYVCLDCAAHLSAIEGTILNDTQLDLKKWLMAVALMVNAQKGLSALQLKRELSLAYKTVWHLLYRIPMRLIEEADDTKLAGAVEADETYVGGRYDKRRKREEDNREEPATNEEPF